MKSSKITTDGNVDTRAEYPGTGGVCNGYCRPSASDTFG